MRSPFPTLARLQFTAVLLLGPGCAIGTVEDGGLIHHRADGGVLDDLAEDTARDLDALVDGSTIDERVGTDDATGAMPDATGCAADPMRACTPGETQACGSCGSQTCSTDCAWGACAGDGACTPGGTQPCGACGTQTCTAGCGWSACAGTGACMPGQTRTQACGACGSQTATCTSSCTWGAWSACPGTGACMPGETRAGSCDPCSHEVCSSSCTWGACTLQAGNACEYRGGRNSRSCSACACGHQWCLSSCQWSTGCTSCCTTCGGCS